MYESFHWVNLSEKCNPCIRNGLYIKIYNCFDISLELYIYCPLNFVCDCPISPSFNGSRSHFQTWKLLSCPIIVTEVMSYESLLNKSEIYICLGTVWTVLNQPLSKLICNSVLHDITYIIGIVMYVKKS